jgi:2,4-dienoyl-CoA reductase-like NADH-dependent reductase (Old Yellow Enzyme family)
LLGILQRRSARCYARRRTVGPSAIPFAPDWPAPNAADRADLARLRQAFAQAAQRALLASFDLVELHCLMAICCMSSSCQ